MDHKYNCDTCKFHTNLTADYNRHLKTKKHINKIDPTVDYRQEFTELKTKYDDLQYKSSITLLELETKINDLNIEVETTNTLLNKKTEIDHHDKLITQYKTNKNMYETNESFAHLF